MKRKRKPRIIATLRKKFPNVTWWYEWPSKWICSAGWSVQAFSCCEISASGGETYHSEYRRSDTSAQVYGLEHGSFVEFI